MKYLTKKMFMVICLVLFVFVGSSISDVEAANVSDSSKLLQIEKIKFVNDEIVLFSSSKVKEQRNVSLNFDFYTYETINGNIFIGDVIGNHQNLINLSLESNPSGYIINIAFYDKITGEYSYYFGEVDEKIIRKITSISQPSSVLDDQYEYLLHNSTKWYMSTFNGNLVSNSDISISKNETEQLLQRYYSSESNNDTLIKTSVYADDVVYCRYYFCSHHGRHCFFSAVWVDTVF